jgi:dihydroxy-acid dehydratase
MPNDSHNGLHEASYIEFKSLPDGALNEDGEPALNKYSSIITRGHDYPGAQVFIYLTVRVHDTIQC